MVNPQLIKDFRLKVNNDSYFTLQHYKNKCGRNYWNLICSCMDWIDVAIDYIVNKESLSDSINIKCMQAYTYISAIDIVWQSIQQLHRAIISKNSVPFSGEKKIFTDNTISCDDNEYFKHIRAVFGAHPVNLNKEGKWFASWPTDHVYLQYDYTVILYNANVDNEHMVFGYRVNELDEFLITRYGYLNLLIEELENQYQSYKKEKANQKIGLSNCIIEQLVILKSEAENRLNNDYYLYIITELLLLYQTNSTLEYNKKAVDKYLNECNKLVEEILVNLQNMELIDLENGYLIDLEHPNEIHYPLSKIYESLREKSNELYDYYLNKISMFLKDFVTIMPDMNDDEVFLLIKVGLFSYWESTKKRKEAT